MWIGAISAIILVFFVIFSILWERFRRKQALILKEEKERQALIIKWHKKEQTQELATLEKRHSQKENTLKKALKSAEIKHAKALANLEEMKKAHEVKKKNLSKYHKKKQDVRREKRSIEEQVKEILGRDDKWNDHSLSGPKSKKIGKPKGANGGGRKRPETFHTSIEFYPQQCKNCGCSLEKASHFRSHDSVITELFHEWDEFKEYKLIRLKNIKRIIYRARCPECKTLTSADLGLFKKARFGPSFISYVIGERIDTALPYNAIIKDMVKMFGPRFIVTPAAIVDWFKKFEKQIGNIYEQLKEMLENQVFAHIDETGLSLRGDNWWLWIICCANLVIYRESSSRGHDAIEDIIKGFEGTIIADFFSAYEKFTDNSHQKCLAHLLGDIIEHVVKLKKQNDKIKKKLKEHKEALLEEKRKAEENPVKKRGRPRKLKKFSDKEMLALTERKERNERSLAQAVRLGDFFREPFIDGMFSWKKPISERFSKEEAEEKLLECITEIEKEEVEDETIARLLKRCKKYNSMLFTYLQQEGMPPDNNRAERGLRKFSRQRKISGDFKSEDVLRNYAMYLSLFMTCEANDIDFDAILVGILTGESVDMRHLLLP